MCRWTMCFYGLGLWVTSYSQLYSCLRRCWYSTVLDKFRSVVKVIHAYMYIYYVFLSVKIAVALLVSSEKCIPQQKLLHTQQKLNRIFGFCSNRNRLIFATWFMTKQKTRLSKLSIINLLNSILWKKTPTEQILVKASG
jgi:hypothetical protein